MDQNLKFIISADSSGMRGASEGVKALQDRINGLQTAIQRNARETQYFQGQIDRLNNEFKEGRINSIQLSQGIQNYDNAIKKASNETLRYQRNIKRLSDEQKKLNISSRGVQGSTRGATQSMYALTGIIQDLPYGIRGVANNVEFFSTSMTQAITRTGSWSGALKELRLSFVGPGGILFAISAVSAAAVALQNVDFDALMDKWSGSTLSLSRALTSVGLSIKDSLGGVESQISTTESLISILQDENSTRQQQLRAYNQLKEISPEIVEGLTFEESKTKDLTDRVNELSIALVRQAKIKGAQQKISEEFSKIIEAENKSLLSQAGILGWLQSAASGNIWNAVISGAENASEQIQKSNDRIKVFQDLLQNLLNEDSGDPFSQYFKDADDEIDEFVNRPIPPIQIPIELSGLDTIDFDTIVAIAEQGGERLAQAFRMVQDGVVEMGSAVAPTIDEINSGLQSLQVPEVDYSGIINQVRDIRRYVDPKIFNEFKDQLYGLNEIELKQLKTELGAINIFTGALSDGVNSMVSSMTQSLDTGSKFFDAFVGSILNSLASLVTELITNAITQIAINQAVSTSNSITAASSTAAASGPLGAFVLPGLIAGAVGAIAAAFSGISFAQGGIVPGGSFTGDRVPAWVNSGEMILNNRQQQNLFGMLNGGINASRPRTPDDGIIASTTVRGSDLLLTLERAKKNNRRFGAGINN